MLVKLKSYTVGCAQKVVAVWTCGNGWRFARVESPFFAGCYGTPTKHQSHQQHQTVIVQYLQDYHSHLSRCYSKSAYALLP